jgi:hypothetical protein
LEQFNGPRDVKSEAENARLRQTARDLTTSYANYILKSEQSNPMKTNELLEKLQRQANEITKQQQELTRSMIKVGK